MGKLGLTEIIVLFIILLLYFLPAYIASNRRAADRTGIFLLNLFLGWTFLGWIGSLIWACTGRREFDPIVFNARNEYTSSSSGTEQANDDFGKKMENIQKLKELLDSGAITQEEFESQKSRILT